jgi:hypothetical protein
MMELLKDFLHDVIAKIIPGMVAVRLFLWSFVVRSFDSFPSGSVLLVPIVFGTAWVIGTLIEVFSYYIATYIFGFKPIDHARFLNADSPDKSSKYKATVKTVADCAMFRNLSCVFSAALIFSLIPIAKPFTVNFGWQVFLLLAITFLEAAFIERWKYLAGQKDLKEDEKKRVAYLELAVKWLLVAIAAAALLTFFRFKDLFECHCYC